MIPIKIAIVGCGLPLQETLLSVLAGAEIRARLEVTAVCDVVPGRALEMCQTYHFDQALAYSDYEAMLRVAEIDVVAIMTPVPYRQAKAALEQGKHIYVSHLLSDCSFEVLELSYLAKEKGLKVESLGHLLDPLHEQAKRMIKDGEIGTLSLLRCGNLELIADADSSNLAEMNAQYKAMLNTLFYPMTIVTGILGPVKQVSIVKENTYMDHEVSILLEFENNVLTRIKGSKSKSQLEFVGTSGEIALGPGINIHSGVKAIHHIIDSFNEAACLPYDGCDQATHVIEVIEKIHECRLSGVVKQLETTFNSCHYREVISEDFKQLNAYSKDGLSYMTI